MAQQLQVPKNLKKLTKPQLIEYVGELEAVVTAYREGYYSDQLQWFGVAWMGWGSWEADVYFTEALVPSGAIDNFIEAINDFAFEGHGSDDYREFARTGKQSHWDSRMAVGSNSVPTIMVYAISEIGWYTEVDTVPVKKEWRKL